MNAFVSACEVMDQQFGRDTVLSLATGTGNEISVRVVNGYYRNGFMYVTTHTATRKMKEVSQNPHVAVCKDLFSARGFGENIGSPKDNRALADELRVIFSAFYDRHVDEDDPGTCILRIALTDAVVFTDDTKYTIDFAAKSAVGIPFRNDIIS